MTDPYEEFDQLEDDTPPPAQQIKPAPTRRSSKSTAAKPKAVRQPAVIAAKASHIPKLSGPSSRAAQDSATAQKLPSDSTSSRALERFRYHAPPSSPPAPAVSLPALKSNNFKPPLLRKASRKNSVKRASTEDQSRSGAPASKRKRVEQPRFHVPPLDENGEPVVPTPLPLASPSKPQRPSDPSSTSSVELPPLVKQRLRQNSSSPAQAPARAQPISQRRNHSSPNRLSPEEERQVAMLMASFEQHGGVQDMLDNELDVEEKELFTPSQDKACVAALMGGDRSEALTNQSGAAPANRTVDAPPTSNSNIASPERPVSVGSIAQKVANMQRARPSSDCEATREALPALPVTTASNAIERSATSGSAGSIAGSGNSRATTAPSRPSPTPAVDSHSPRGPLRPPPDLLAILAANKAASPPPPRPQMLLVPLSLEGLTTHMSTLLSTNEKALQAQTERAERLSATLSKRDQELVQLRNHLRETQGRCDGLQSALNEAEVEKAGLERKVDVLREVRRGLLGDMKEYTAKIEELAARLELQEAQIHGSELPVEAEGPLAASAKETGDSVEYQEEVDQLEEDELALGAVEATVDAVALDTA